MSMAQNLEIATAEAEAHGGRIAPVLMGAAFLAIGLFGVFLAAKAPDQYGYIAGFGFLVFSFLMSMRYFSRRI